MLISRDIYLPTFLSSYICRILVSPTNNHPLSTLASLCSMHVPMLSTERYTLHNTLHRPPPATLGYCRPPVSHQSRDSSLPQVSIPSYNEAPPPTTTIPIITSISIHKPFLISLKTPNNPCLPPHKPTPKPKPNKPNQPPRQ